MSYRSSLADRLFVTITLLFVAFAGSFVAYQYNREREYKVKELDSELQAFNKDISSIIGICPDADTLDAGTIGKIEAYCAAYTESELRLSIINDNGKVIYDNRAKNYSELPDHSNRKEIAIARSSGKGYDIKRSSESTEIPYFYDATYFPESGCFVRTALPYNASLMKMLASDKGYVWFAVAMSLILILIYYRFIRRLGRNISSLRDFANRVEAGEEPVSSDFSFPDNDLGEISKDIVKLYSQRMDSEDDKTRLKRQLTQNIAHELKTPVSSIQGYLETIMTDKKMSRETMEQFLSRCYAQSNRLSNLLRDISLLTSMDESSQSFEITEVDLHRLIDEVKWDVNMQLSEKKMRFFNLTSGPMPIKGNQPLLYSIFRNLTDNAVAYAGEGTSIIVRSIKEDTDSYEFSFSDNGVGVAEEHLPHLFERFYRIDTGRSRKLGGTGLGLAIVKNAVIMHKGTISVREAVTGGLEFVFSLKKSR